MGVWLPMSRLRQTSDDPMVRSGFLKNQIAVQMQGSEAHDTDSIIRLC
jgi:hypothetical protein